MAGPKFNVGTANNNRFAMIPRPDVPRSTFNVQQLHKTTFDAGWVIPIYVDEVLPGDSFKVKMTALCRMSTPIFPIMDNLHLDSHFFFVPCRLLWENFQRMMGEQDAWDSSIDYLVPQVVSAADGFPVNSIYDYFGLPTVGQVGVGNDVSVNSLPLRAYNLIYQEWFRDQNLDDAYTINMGDGPDAVSDYNLGRRMKRHDYFTSCLPWPQKGDPVMLPLGLSAPVRGIGVNPNTQTVANINVWESGTATNPQVYNPYYHDATVAFVMKASASGVRPDIYADLTEASAVTINQLREAFQIQKLLERNARGGTRYTEIVRSHFGVISPDARMQRPEYIGGGSTPIQINPIAQQSATTVSGSTSPLGTLAAIGTAVARDHRFSYSATEHGYIIGLVSVRSEQTYQQGLHRMWSRRTRYDFYWPSFAHLGEQAVLQQEIFVSGFPAEDELVFGYQERWAEYRYKPSRVSGLFRSTSPGTLDAWHLAQEFVAAPELNVGFIQEDPPMSRVLAVGDEIEEASQFIFDSLFDVRMTRPLPTFSVPGLVDHF